MSEASLPLTKNKIEPRRRPISPDDLLARARERDEREQGDNRTPAQRWLGDPPQGRSALAQRKIKAL